MKKEDGAIYDDESFFRGYVELRQDENNYNDLIEQPIIFSLIGSVLGKRVLDLGCGWGETTVKIADMGAKSVLGIDASVRMIERAQTLSHPDSVSYRVLPLERLCELTSEFDLAVSCLAIHYVEDLGKLFSDIYARLSPGGELVFSMEHPMYTASIEPQRWLRAPDGVGYVAYVSDHYSNEGVRHIEWLGKSVRKYHHKSSTVINSLIDCGFTVERVIEPSPSEELIRRIPKAEREYHRPVYLIVKCKKP